MIIQTIMASVFFAFFTIEVFMPHKHFPILNRKPFNCVPCLSAWSAFVLWFLPEVVTEFILTMFGAGTLGTMFRLFILWYYRKTSI